jgi:hypothetical protein
MKTLLFALALLVPGLASAYPQPNVTLKQSTGQMVDMIWIQPIGTPVVVADASAAEK